MLPNSKTQTRTIYVKGHKRNIASDDPENEPIVERMTRARLKGLTPEDEEEWKTASVNAILGLTPRVSDQASILNFLNKKSTSEAGTSDLSRSDAHDDEGPSQSPKKKYGPNNWMPTTPEGLTRDERDGINAAIIVWTPTPPRKGKGKGKM